MTDRSMEVEHTEGWTHRKLMFLHIFTMRGSDVASLIEFHPVV